MFQPVSSQPNFPQLEEAILEFWEKDRVFEKSVDQRKNGPRFTLYEGPPTANGRPGVHHVISRVFKDVIPRYRAMKGYYTPRIAGWDTHGLPVELEVEKELGFTSKKDIEDYGIDRFTARCRESVFRYLKDWNALTKRIGFWIDLDHPYITMENDYIESCWWAIRSMWDKKLVYRGYKTAAHCPRCGTSLSSHEVALGYRDDVEDPSIFVKFEIDKNSLPATLPRSVVPGDQPLYFLAWTTTPWTLPGNTALAILPQAEYSLVLHNNELLILASERRKAVGLEEGDEIARLPGDRLIGLRYYPLYDPHQFNTTEVILQSTTTSEPLVEPYSVSAPVNRQAYPVIAMDTISMDEGTGVVHIAPAFGEEDFELGKANGLLMVQHVNAQGLITGTYPFSGKFVKQADPDIISDLQRRGLLYRSETIRHTYPFCWRCGTPLLYYVKYTWYIKTSAMKEQLIACNEKINWYPEYIKHGRFGEWLRNNVDWAVSRERYWGTPLPIWQCPDCNHYECIGSIEDLSSRPGFSGFVEPVDLHRPYIDLVVITCPHCSGTMKRVPDVLDCWFDSGSMPIAQWHYPFENKEIFTDGRFPADYICEAVDQTRGWFYSLHAISTLLFGQPSYRNVICLGHILDEKGEKMSKAKGNAVEPWAVINRYGADALRWYFYIAAPPGNSRRFSESLVAEASRRFLLTLWNVYSFWVTYANIDHFDPAQSPEPVEIDELDKWLNSELNQLILDVDNLLGSYDPYGAARKIQSFVDYLSNWYVRRSRRRFWKSENDADKLAAYHTLYHCLVTLAKLLAPFTPFLAEAIYQNLVRNPLPQAPPSVHLADFPLSREGLINPELMASTRLVMKVASLARAARSEAGIKVRQPLSQMLVRLPSPEDIERLEPLKAQLMDEVNVKEIKLTLVKAVEAPGWVNASDSEIEVAIDTTLTARLVGEGIARELIHRLQTMRRNAAFNISDRIRIYYHTDPELAQIIQDFADYIQRETLAVELVDHDPPDNCYQDKLHLAGHSLHLGVARLG